jgi:hypothetical protein
MAGWTAAESCENVVARSHGRGEELTHDDGSAKVAEGSSPSGFGAGSAFTGGEDFRLGDGTARPVFIFAGDSTAANPITMRKLSTSLVLSTISPDVVLVAEEIVAPGTIPNGDRECLWEFAAFPGGAPTRTYPRFTTGNHLGFSTPCLIMCNADENGPKDSVLMHPADPNIASFDDRYSELWESTFPGAIGVPSPLAYPFKAQSVETFYDRLNFLNTKEGGVSYTNRLRWTAVATADPSNAQIGSGFIDMQEFKRPGLRVESLGNTLACYFGDGVALVTRTGSYADPYRYQVVGHGRGALSTKSICRIHANVHFGIFDDGWWRLNFAGQWSPQGVLEVRESGERDVLTYKFKRTFYNLLDIGRRHLITTVFDPWHRRVLIAWPVIGTSSQLAVWSYDVDTDRVWPLGMMDVTAWATVDRILRSATQWAGMGTTTWGQVSGSWADYGAQTGLRSVIQGRADGYILGWDPTLTKRDGVEPNWNWYSHRLSILPDPDRTVVYVKGGIEYTSQGASAPGFSITSVASPGAHSQARQLVGNEGPAGEIHVGYAHFRNGGSNHQLILGGTWPFGIRSFRHEFFHGMGDTRNFERS